MKRALFSLSVFAFVYGGAAASALRLRSDAGSTKNGASDLYRSGAPVKLNGKILSVEEHPNGGDLGEGVEAHLDVAGEDVLVHLGPRWFLLQNDLQLTHGEPLAVEGVRIGLQKEPAVIASEVVQNEHRVRLRDSQGTPSWSAPEAPRR